MGTLSKAAGLSGGYVACSRAWADVMINSARSLIYSTAPPPALAAAALAAVRIISGEEGKALRRHVSALAEALSAALGTPGRPVSSIFPVVIGENEAALSAAQRLLEQGFLAPAIRYPTVPRGNGPAAHHGDGGPPARADRSAGEKTGGFAAERVLKFSLSLMNVFSSRSLHLVLSLFFSSHGGGVCRHRPALSGRYG